jgi:hypothetical protein
MSLCIDSFSSRDGAPIQWNQCPTKDTVQAIVTDPRHLKYNVTMKFTEYL